jgi:putative FmdB family regulatory protein
MPTYEYRCGACAHEFEIEQRITDAKLEKCPSCKKKKLVRLVGTGNFILKGGGWYKDLYSSTPKKTGSDDKKSDAGETKSDKGESKSDKSEKKADAGKTEKKAEKKAKAD